MNILQPKVDLLKDITSELASSIKSAGNIRNQCENFLNRLELELTLRLNERAHFITKAGITLRDLLLEDYRRLINQVHSEYCAHQEIFLRMTEQYQSLQMTINNTEFAIQELKKIRKWSFDESKYGQLAQNISFGESFSFNKENHHLQPYNTNRTLPLRSDWKLEDSMNEKKYKKDWMRVKMSSRQRREQLINMQRKLQEAEIAEISVIIDECLRSLTDFSYLRSSKKFKEVKLSESFSRNSSPEPLGNSAHGISLGLQSLNDEVNLLCNELIDDFNVSRGSQLQRITEREDEEIESESNATPHKRLTESTD